MFGCSKPKRACPAPLFAERLASMGEFSRAGRMPSELMAFVGTRQGLARPRRTLSSGPDSVARVGNPGIAQLSWFRWAAVNLHGRRVLAIASIVARSRSTGVLLVDAGGPGLAGPLAWLQLRWPKNVYPVSLDSTPAASFGLCEAMSRSSYIHDVVRIHPPVTLSDYNMFSDRTGQVHDVNCRTCQLGVLWVLILLWDLCL